MSQRSFLALIPGESATPYYSPLAVSDIPVTTGNVYYLDPVNGSDANPGTLPATAVKTLAAGYALLVEGNNDVLVLIGNGLAAGSAFLSTGFDWHKDAAHFVGVCAPTLFSPRARIAPTAAITPFANFFTVSGSGCYFSNLEFVTDFTVGVAAEICMTVTGQRNVFHQCHFAGMIGATAAGSTTSRNLLLSGAGENLFRECVIGVDSTPRTDANSSVEFAAYATRTIFLDCRFPIYVTGSGTGAFILKVGSHGLDRVTEFTRCKFWNAATLSGGSLLAVMATATAPAFGGLAFSMCSFLGITAIGDTAAKAIMYFDNPAPSQTFAMTLPS
jgi:hypothetical protein